MIATAGPSYLWPKRPWAGVGEAGRRWWFDCCAVRLLAWNALAIATGSA